MNAPTIPTFEQVRGRHTTTRTGATLGAYNLGPRWCRITLDRCTATLYRSAWPAGPTRVVMAELADHLATLFVHSHASGLCFVSSFDNDYVTLTVPRATADLSVAMLLLAELGDTTFAEWVLPLVRDAAEQVRAQPRRIDRRRMAGPLVDELAVRMLEVTRW